jgi:hypothetical protein
VVIRDLDIIGIAFGPAKTDTPLIVDSDAELAWAIPLKGLEPIPWRHSQIL